MGVICIFGSGSVRRDLKFDAAERTPPVEPSRGEFKGWLRREYARAGQPNLPGTGGGELGPPSFNREREPQGPVAEYFAGVPRGLKRTAATATLSTS